MSKVYNIEVKLDSKKWTLVDVKMQHKDALHYVKEHGGRYPIRVVRVVRTIVFDGSK